MEAKQIPIKTLFISLAAVFSIEGATRLVTAEGLYPPLTVLGTARLLQLVLVVLIVLVWGKGLPSIGLAPSRLVFGLKRGLLWSAGFGAAALLSIIVLSILHIDLLPMIQTKLPASQRELILFFLIGAMVGPVAEEVFFRGILYGFFRRWGVVVALIFSTLLFVLSHPLHGGLPFTQIVGGVLFAVAYEVEGSLMVPITIHVLANTAIFTLSLLS